MIYCYYDKNGILREIVNIGANRQGTSVNQIYAYFEDDNFASATITYQVGSYIANDSYFVGVTSIVGDSRSVLPYNDKINYKYFKDNTPYKFYIFEIPADILILNGVCRATITTRWSGGQPKHVTQGLLTFNIENEVISDEVLLESQYQYLLDRLGAYEFFANFGIVGTLDSIVDGGTAAESYREGSFILQRVENTSEYQGGLNVVGVKLYRVINGVYSLLYSSVETTDLANYLNGVVYSHTTRINSLSTRVDVLEEKIADVVLKSDLEDYAKKDDLRWYALKSELPTKLSQLENDTAFITNAVSDLINYYKKDETLSKEEILEKIAAIETIRFEVYASLDEIETPKSNVIYLIGTESPYKEYIYVESIGFEEIGKLEIDLSNYVQSDNVLSSGNLVFGSGEKKVVDSGVSLDTTGLSNSTNKIPTSFIVSKAIAQYHEVATINGDSGTIALTSILSKYRLIVDENLLVYRRVLSETNKIVYHAKYLVDNTHTRDYFLTLTEIDGLNYNYVRTYIENVSHTEFDNLVSNTPTDLTYDSESRKMQLVHDGNAIGSGIVLEGGAFTPYFDNSGLVLSDLDTLDSEVATKEYVDTAIANAITNAIETEY